MLRSNVDSRVYWHRLHSSDSHKESSSRSDECPGLGSMTYQQNETLKTTFRFGDQ